jgi:8-oxo-dGTP pyrophosphatase MutT (NUDIX family)
MPAASILPVALYKNKLYFLFGKENPMENSASGFSDFGGGMEAGESALDAALREGSEELTGFLGTRQDLKKRLKKNGVYKIKYEFEDKNTYTIHIFPMSYDLEFVKYFNDNHAFLWGKMNKTLLNNSRLFEKIKVDWFCEDELQKRMSEYRPFYRDIVKTIMGHRANIRSFMRKCTATRRRVPIRGRYTRTMSRRKGRVVQKGGQ